MCVLIKLILIPFEHQFMLPGCLQDSNQIIQMWQQIHENIFLSQTNQSLSPSNEQNPSSTVHLIEGGSNATLDMFAIHDFSKRLDSLRLSCELPSDRVVVYPSKDDAESISTALTLVGAYLILKRSLTLEAVLDSFRELGPAVMEADSDAMDMGMVHCWRALDRAMQLGWLAAPESRVEPDLDVEEFGHYARRVNGEVHMAVPGKMYFFSSPEVLPSERKWLDRRPTADAAPTTRHFSPAFYADLFEDLGVSTVVCLGRSDAAASSAFAARGIELVDLALAQDGSSLLRCFDRLLSVAAAASGAVAVHSGDGFKWPAYIGTLVAAYLISRLGFEEGAAWAWIRLLCPWMLAAAPAAPRRTAA
jgi:hypothetical protein